MAKRTYSASIDERYWPAIDRLSAQLGCVRSSIMRMIARGELLVSVNPDYVRTAEDEYSEKMAARLNDPVRKQGTIRKMIVDAGLNPPLGLVGDEEMAIEMASQAAVIAERNKPEVKHEPDNRPQTSAEKAEFIRLDAQFGAGGWLSGKPGGKYSADLDDAIRFIVGRYVELSRRGRVGFMPVIAGELNDMAMPSFGGAKWRPVDVSWMVTKLRDAGYIN